MLPCAHSDIVSPISCALSCMNCWRMACILLATWNVDFALLDEREKNRMQKESNELGALISKLQLDDDEMSIETYI